VIVFRLLRLTLQGAQDEERWQKFQEKYDILAEMDDQKPYYYGVLEGGGSQFHLSRCLFVCLLLLFLLLIIIIFSG
jgi:hypothetical protein